MPATATATTRSIAALRQSQAWPAPAGACAGLIGSAARHARESPPQISLPEIPLVRKIAAELGQSGLGPGVDVRLLGG